jgi:hypothetical protein
MPNIDKEVHTNTYMLSHLGSTVTLPYCRVPEVLSNELHVVTSRSTVKQNTLLSRPRSTVKRTTCCHVPDVPSNKLRCCRVPEVPSNELHCCRVPEVPSNELHCCRVPEVPLNKLHAVAFRKDRQSNYILSNPRNTVKGITCCHIPEVLSIKLHVSRSRSQ